MSDTAQQPATPPQARRKARLEELQLEEILKQDIISMLSNPQASDNALTHMIQLKPNSTTAPNTPSAAASTLSPTEPPTPPRHGSSSLTQGPSHHAGSVSWSVLVRMRRSWAHLKHFWLVYKTRGRQRHVSSNMAVGETEAYNEIVTSEVDHKVIEKLLATAED